MELEEAVDRGASFIKNNGIKPEVAVAELQGMDGGTKAMARIGMAREIKSMFDNPAAALSKVNQILNSNRLKPIVEEMFGSPEAFNRFRANLVRERVMLDRSAKITDGSNTINKAAESEDLGAAPGIIKDAFTGHPIRAAINTVGAINTRVRKGINERTANSLGEFLSSSDPARQAEILSMIENQFAPGALSKLLGRSGAIEAPQADSRNRIT